MPADKKIAAESKRVKPRHGKVGYIRQSADISPEMKDRLVAQAEKNKVFLTEVIRDAFDFYLDAVEAV